MKHPKDVLNYSCKDCKLWHSRSQVVWGAGNPIAKIGFIGEGPGVEEDESGIAFVGRAGRLLRKILKHLDLTIEDVIILNVVKCRPPHNRNPKPKEIEACKKYLDLQFKCLKKLTLMVCLGRVSWTAITNRIEPVTKEHGRLYNLNGIYYLYTFHPSYLLRNPSPELRNQFISDIIKAKRIVKKYGKT